ncbi:hypothetical protein FA95DRAFT_1488242 [Auriscalpium vulgare]|uniref:Uncharacterized protein n=1 Tax=Auriscalpium vulgare TaxID=40419 RepID=A0ACB8S035_9AGAM|nr:hypothetical protein FA95DRAFT_1488242 [Auriscalpium vulgare]
MLNSVTNFFYERRRGFAKAAGVSGGVYLVGRYVSSRLKDVRDRVVQERAARENLRKRFQANMEDISFTVMARLPMLGTHVLQGMDIESLTAELQSRSKSQRLSHPTPAPSQEALQPPNPAPTSPEPSSMESSIEILRNSDSVSENGSISVLSYSVQDESSDSRLAESRTSWVDSFSNSTHSQQTSEASSSDQKVLADAPHRHSDALTSESGLSSSAVSSYGDSDLVTSQMSVDTRSKAEIWREIKMLTVTRTLTVMYSMTLLSVFTNIQLSLLGRFKYVQSVIQLERDEEERAKFDTETSVASLFFSFSERRADEWEDESIWREGVSEETERKFLTLSWWILNVGWKDVGERVRRGVEEVFEDVSLKGKLGVVELHRLISDVRRRVEHEITFEGRERRINFLSTLLPPTSSALSHLLTHGGFPPAHTDVHEPAFTTLLEETRDLLASADFAVVLERSLDRATEVLFDGLSKNVFVGEEQEGDAVRLRLASVLPGLARWTNLALNGLPNELVDVCYSAGHLFHLLADVPVAESG